MLFTKTLMTVVICKGGGSVEDDRPSGNLDTEHMELATEGEDGLGTMVGAANAILLFWGGVALIAGVTVLVSWIFRHGR